MLLYSRRDFRIEKLVAMFGLALLLGGVVHANDARQASLTTQDDLWHKSVDLIGRGEFDSASDVISRVTAGGDVSEQVRKWLDEYRDQQEMRKRLARADFEKYIGYSKARIERKEYTEALEWVSRAADVSEDRETFLGQGGWIERLVTDSLAHAKQLCQERDWRGAWQIYWRLEEMYDGDPTYRKLTREALTHLRLDLIFEEEDTWKERLEHVRWQEGERSLHYVDLYYVTPVNFKDVAKSGLEQLLMLSESKTAQELFEGLGDPDYRREFQDRVRYHLDRVMAAPTVDCKATVQCFRRVVKDINTQTVQLPEELVVGELMRGAFEPLDDFTTVIWPTEAEEFQKHTDGEFIGVGISIILNELEEIEVSSPIEDTPAYRAGIQAGDVILKADDTDLKGYSLTKAVQTITGPKGTPVTLVVRRDGKNVDFTLIRDVVKIHSVKGVKRSEEDETRWDYWLDKDNGIGYIRVNGFQANTVRDLSHTILDLTTQGLKGLVLDLRGNPGGLLSSAAKMTSLFLQKDDVVVGTKGRDLSEDLSFSTDRDGPFVDLPLAVLVDESSASASEIVSGAIRDNHRGTVIGQRTFGKFSVQNLVPLGRTNAKLKITTASYYLPSGVSLHRNPGSKEWGVEPDIPVHLATKERIKIYTMRREADRIGSALTDASDEDEDDAGDDGEVPENVTRFKVKRPHLAKLDIKPGDPEAKLPPTVKLNDEVIAVVAEDSEGRELKVISLEINYGELEVVAADANGKEVPVAALTVDEHLAERIELPRLIQLDENDRPEIDPQLDAALLVLRANLLGQWFPKLAAAQIEPDTEPSARQVRP